MLTDRAVAFLRPLTFSAAAQVPQYALFQRLELSEQERATRAEDEGRIVDTEENHEWSSL